MNDETTQEKSRSIKIHIAHDQTSIQQQQIKVKRVSLHRNQKVNKKKK